MFFLFMVGILRRDAMAAAFAMIVFFLHGSKVWGIFHTTRTEVFAQTLNYL